MPLFQVKSQIEVSDVRKALRLLKSPTFVSPDKTKPCFSWLASDFLFLMWFIFLTCLQSQTPFLLSGSQSVSLFYSKVMTSRVLKNYRPVSKLGTVTRVLEILVRVLSINIKTIDRENCDFCQFVTFNDCVTFLGNICPNVLICWKPDH